VSGSLSECVSRFHYHSLIDGDSCVVVVVVTVVQQQQQQQQQHDCCRCVFSCSCSSSNSSMIVVVVWLLSLCLEVLIFLDSHCEVNVGWLEPLLTHIQADRHNVAVPIIDIINHDSFAVEPSPLVRGGFNWGLFYRWDPVPQSMLQDKLSFISPIK